MSSFDSVAAAAVRPEHEQLRQVLDGLYVFVSLLSPAGVLQETNRASLEAGGLSLEAVRGLPLWDAPWWSHDSELQTWLRDAVGRSAAGETVRQEISLRMQYDSRMEVDFMLAPVTDATGVVTHLVASGMDISERRASERALRDSDDSYRRVFEGSTVGKALIDASGHILIANPTLAAMLGYTTQEMVGMPVHQLVPQRKREGHVGLVRGFMAEPKRRFMAERQELYAVRKDGSEFPIEIALNPMREGDNRQVLATVSDVTERRAALNAMEKALKEKTVLLNEVHHRVKNNLQVISSLLNLQSRGAEPSVQAALRDSQSRVRSMALMHQLLYERADFSALELGPYLVRLGTLLRETYLGGSSTVKLKIDAPQTGLRIELQRAIPCGLLVNELVSNAIKHAFPNGASGTISIYVENLEGGEAVVHVADDGCGLPPGVVPGEGRGLGFQLLPVLADQCSAQLEQIPGTGTHFSLRLTPDAVAAEDALPTPSDLGRD